MSIKGKAGPTGRSWPERLDGLPEGAHLILGPMRRAEALRRMEALRAVRIEPLEQSWHPQGDDQMGRMVLRLDQSQMDALIGQGSGGNGPVEVPGNRGRVVSVPAEDGYCMPAEWGPNEACWMAWPCRETIWGDHIAEARRASADLARTIAGFEPVRMLVRPEQAEHARRLCGPEVTVIPMPIDDSWTRDTGPSFLLGPAGAAGVDWIFNGYGNVYVDHGHDDIMARTILDRIGARRYVAPMVLEGGAVHVDGQGALLAVEQCLLNPNRNPDLDRAEVERLLQDHLGVSTIIWLGRGLPDDESSGHVSHVACFTRPGQVLVQTTRDPDDEYYWIAQDNIQRLRGARDARGRKLEVVEVDGPAPRIGPRGRRLPLSYVNFYLANHAVVMPAFDDPADAAAKFTLESLFPDRTVVQVPALDIVRGGGGIHCAALNQPAIHSR